MFRVTQEIPGPGSRKQLHSYCKVPIKRVWVQSSQTSAFFPLCRVTAKLPPYLSTMEDGRVGVLNKYPRLGAAVWGERSVFKPKGQGKHGAAPAREKGL